MLLSKFLTVFMNTATTGSVKVTAEKINVSPAAVSAMIKKTEDILNLKLFIYQNGRMNLTDHGLYLYNSARQPYDILSNIGSALRNSITLTVEVEDDIFFMADEIRYHSLKHIKKNININFRSITDSTTSPDLIIKGHQIKTDEFDLVSTISINYIHISPKNISQCQHVVLDNEIVRTTYKGKILDHIKNTYPNYILLYEDNLGVKSQWFNDGHAIIITQDITSLPLLINKEKFPYLIKETPFHVPSYFYIHKNTTIEKENIINEIIKDLKTKTRNIDT